MSILPAIAAQILHLALMLAAAPTVGGLLNWLTARLAGYRGPPILLPWTEMSKLLRKQAGVAESASSVFRVAPAAGFGLMLTVAALVPSFTLGMAFAPLADLVAIAGLLAAGRIVLVLAALDTGTAPAGLAAGQVITRATMVEPALLLVVFTLALLAGSSNLDLVVGLQVSGMLQPNAASALAAAALAGLAFADSAEPPGRIEAEFSGPNLALVQATAALRLVVWLDLISALFLPLGMAQSDGTPVGWLIGLGSWAIRLLGFTIVLAVLQSVLGKPQWRSMPAFLGVTALLALLAAMLVLANTAAA
jgi:formate hydrogenlyase subunit 4